MKLEPLQSQESLLQDTILVLKQRQGASLAQIRKRLEMNGADGKLDEAKKKMLSSILKNLVLKGKVEKIGSVYKLAQGTPAQSNPEQSNSAQSNSAQSNPTEGLNEVRRSLSLSKRHPRLHKLRRRTAHRHRRHRRRTGHRPRGQRRHIRRRRALPHKRNRRHRKQRRRKGHSRRR